MTTRKTTSIAFLLLLASSSVFAGQKVVNQRLEYHACYASELTAVIAKCQAEVQVVNLISNSQIQVSAYCAQAQKTNMWCDNGSVEMIITMNYQTP